MAEPTMDGSAPTTPAPPSLLPAPPSNVSVPDGSVTENQSLAYESAASVASNESQAAEIGDHIHVLLREMEAIEVTDPNSYYDLPPEKLIMRKHHHRQKVKELNVAGSKFQDSVHGMRILREDKSEMENVIRILNLRLAEEENCLTTIAELIENWYRVQEGRTKTGARDKASDTPGSGCPNWLPNPKMPDVTLAKFSGDYVQYRSFMSQFRIFVDTNEKITKVQKLVYLKSLLTAEAKVLIEGLEDIEENYDLALSLLQANYSQPELLKQKLLSELHDIKLTAKGAKPLRLAFANVVRGVNQLATAGVVLDPTVLASTVERNMPPWLLRRVEREKVKPDDPWTNDGFLEAIERVLKEDERLETLVGLGPGRPELQRQGPRQANTISPSFRIPQDHQQSSPSSPTAPAFQTAYQTPEQHKNDWYRKKNEGSTTKRGGFEQHGGIQKKENEQQEKFGPVTPYSKQVSRPPLLTPQEERICYRCNQPGHIARFCSQREQKQNEERQGRQQEPRTRSPNPAKRVSFSPSPDRAHSRTWTASTVQSMKAKSKSINDQAPPPQYHPCLLKTTAVYKDNSLAITAFLDSGCSQDIIAEDVAEMLQLPTLESGHQTVVTLGNKQEAVSYRTCLLTLRSKAGNEYKVNVKVIKGMNDLIGFLPVVRISEQDKNHLKKVSLCLPTTEEVMAKSVKPQLILSNQNMWSLLTEQPMTLPSGLVLLKTMLGSIVTSKSMTTMTVPKTNEPNEAKMSNEVNDNDDGKTCNDKPTKTTVIKALLSNDVTENDSKTKSMFSVAKSKCPMTGSMTHPTMTKGSMETPKSKTPTKTSSVQGLADDYENLDSIGIGDDHTKNDDKESTKIFNETTYFDEAKKRYVVRIPYKLTANALSTNRPLALSRLNRQVELLKVDPERAARYSAAHKANLDAGFIEPVDENAPADGPLFYTPQHDVYTPDKATTKTRIVNDAAAGNPSINEVTYKGPKVLPKLVEPLTRFRTRKVAIVADIRKAFNQLLLHVNDRDSTRFLYLKDDSKLTTTNNVQCFRYTRLLFGFIFSPAWLGLCILYHLKKVAEYASSNTKQVAKAIEKNLYVDNVMTTVNDANEANTFVMESVGIFSLCSMPLREFASNMPTLDIPEEYKVKDVAKVKVLGLPWNVNTDTMTLPLNKMLTKTVKTVNDAAAVTHGTFDPCGWISPVTFKVKRQMQEVWKADEDNGRKVKWKDELTQEDQEKWNALKDELSHTTNVSLPRCVVEHPEEDVIQLHVFTDASSEGMAAALYIRTENKDGKVQVHLVASKSKITPIHLKSASIHKLEMIGIQMGTDLINQYRTILELPIQSEYIWTDSAVSLAWLQEWKTKGRLKTRMIFIENRCRYISQHCQSELRHVRGCDNPSDLATRGCGLEQLKEEQKWWFGPDWLAQDESYWPSSSCSPSILFNYAYTSWASESSLAPLSPGCRSIAPVCPTLSSPGKGEKPLFRVENVSELGPLLRKTSRILKAAKNFKRGKDFKNQYTNQLMTLVSTDNEIKASDQRAALYQLIKWEQGKFPRQCAMTDKVTKWQIVKDSYGVQRKYDRMQFSKIPVTRKFPIYLPYKSQLTKMIIRDMHKNLKHAGAKTIFANLSQLYFVPRGRKLVKSMLNRCTECQKVDLKPFKMPPFPAFPEERVTLAPPWSFTGADYIGPIPTYMDGQNIKIWVIIFTCASSRMTHLEPVFNLTTECCFNAVLRFICRRNRPRKIISDQAGPFQGTDNFLRQFQKRGIEWEFTTPFAAWEGGFYERLIGIFKDSLKKSTSSKMDYDNLVTVISEIECAMNVRELADNLRPIDLLCPEWEPGSWWSPGKVSLSPPSIPNTTETVRALLQEREAVKQEFQRIWTQDYLQILRERKEWHRQKPGAAKRSPHEGEVVLVDDGTRPIKMAKVESIYKGKDDGKIRQANVKLKSGKVLKRSISQLVPLELERSGPGDKKAKNPQTPHKTPINKRTKTPPIRAKKTGFRRRVPLAPFLFFLFCSWISGCVGVRYCDKEWKNKVIMYHEACTKEGRTVAMDIFTGHVCFANVCRNKGLVSYGRGHKKCLDLPCYCPSWAHGCVFSTTVQWKQQWDKDLREQRPTMCSMTLNDSCSTRYYYETFNQIQAANGQYYLLNNMNIVTSDFNEQYQCYGQGEFLTGTEIFCSTHQCDPDAQKFCLFPRQEYVFLLLNDEKIPILKWGSVRKKVYYSKNYQLLSDAKKMQPEKVMIKCLRDGVELMLPNNSQMVRVCADAFCYDFIRPPSLHRVPLPMELSLTGYDVNVKLWLNGVENTNVGIFCQSQPLCEAINCTLCWRRVLYPQCNALYLALAVIAMIYFTAQIIYIFTKLKLICIKTGQCTKYCSKMGYKVCKAMARCLCWIKKTGQRFWKNNDISPSLSSSTSSSSRPSSRMKTKAVMTSMTLVLLIQMMGAKGCSTMTTLTAKQEECQLDKTGVQRCKINQASRITLSPQGQRSCLNIKNSRDKMIGSMEIETKASTAKCQRVILYHTRQFEMKSQSVKRCPNMGSCSGEKCKAVKLDTKVEELKGEANDNLGFTFCQDSAGCWSESCFYCTAACLFYRTFAKSTSEKIYEIFDCPTFTMEQNVKITLNGLEKSKTSKRKKPRVHETLLSDSIEEKTLTLIPAVTQTWSKIHFTLISSTMPIIKLDKKFMTDKQKTAFIDAAPQGQPVKNMVGHLQCDSEEKAKKMDCSLPSDTCQCQAQSENVACQCPVVNLEKALTASGNLLPINNGIYNLIGEGESVVVSPQKFSSIELQLQFDGYSLVTRFSNNKCKMKVMSISGCYNCITGAKLTYQCTTNFGETVAQVKCTTVTFLVKCKRTSVEATTTLKLMVPEVKEHCVVMCPGGGTNVMIKGKLEYIVPEKYVDTNHQITNEIREATTGMKNDVLKDIARWFQANWQTMLFVILGILLGLLLLFLLTPILVQWLTFGFQRMFRSMFDQGPEPEIPDKERPKKKKKTYFVIKKADAQKKVV